MTSTSFGQKVKAHTPAPTPAPKPAPKPAYTPDPETAAPKFGTTPSQVDWSEWSNESPRPKTTPARTFVSANGDDSDFDDGFESDGGEKKTGRDMETTRPVKKTEINKTNSKDLDMSTVMKLAGAVGAIGAGIWAYNAKDDTIDSAVRAIRSPFEKVADHDYVQDVKQVVHRALGTETHYKTYSYIDGILDNVYSVCVDYGYNLKPDSNLVLQSMKQTTNADGALVGEQKKFIRTYDTIREKEGALARQHTREVSDQVEALYRQHKEIVHLHNQQRRNVTSGTANTDVYAARIIIGGIAAAFSAMSFSSASESSISALVSCIIFVYMAILSVMGKFVSKNDKTIAEPAKTTSTSPSADSGQVPAEVTTD